MVEPCYQDIPASDIAEFKQDGVAYRRVAGELFGRTMARLEPVASADDRCCTEWGKATIPTMMGIQRSCFVLRTV